MPKLDTNANNLPGHAARTLSGQLRKIRSDTQIDTLEQRYNADFEVRGDMEWGTYKELTGVNSVKEALKNLKGS